MIRQREFVFQLFSVDLQARFYLYTTIKMLSDPDKRDRGRDFQFVIPNKSGCALT